MQLLIRSLVYISLILSISCVSKRADKKIIPPPNVIFILADDLGYGDLGVYGQQKIKTPHIDKLASEGITFTRHYAGSTVCAPSRCVLMTGKHTGKARVRGNVKIPLLAEDATIAEVMKVAGYVTGMVGKWGLGEIGSTGAPLRKGFDYFYGFINQTRAHNSYPEYVWENEVIDSLDNVVQRVPETFANGIGGIATTKNTYIQDKFIEKTLQFLEQNKDTSFFLYLPYTLPHANNEARYWDSLGLEVPDFGIYENENWTPAQKAYAAMVSYLDKDVGTIMDALKKYGIDEHTLVIFTSDNGPHREGGNDPDFFNSNGDLRGIKRDLFEGGIRVPMIARWPETITAGLKSDHISAFWDVMPTLCEITQQKSPAETDGISFLPVLLNKEQAKHKFLYWEFFEQGGKQAVLMEDWKLIKLDVDDPAKTVVHLFDLAQDPGEQNDVASQHPDIVKKGHAFMEKAHVYSSDFHFKGEVKRDN